VLAALVAVGADSFAGRGAGGASEAAACKRFCDENGLSFVVMQRIQKLRKQLAKLAKLRLGPCAKGVATTTGGITYNMPPPNRLQENILSQVCAPKQYWISSTLRSKHCCICSTNCVLFPFLFSPLYPACSIMLLV
jgi:hypothetical protein